jgi:catechol 2,3-dioxygenase-like lactoylglutathione lyase family enzyme
MEQPSNCLHHVGLVVKDLQGVSRCLALLGLTIEKAVRYPATQTVIHGRPAEPYVLKVAFAPLGHGVTLEIIEEEEGRSIHREILEKAGGGVDHLAFEVADLQGAVAAFEAAGSKVALIPHGEQSDAVYVDTRGTIGIYTELMQRGKLKPRLETYELLEKT